MANHLSACTQEIRGEHSHLPEKCYGLLQELQISSREGPDGKLPQEREGYWH